MSSKGFFDLTTEEDRLRMKQECAELRSLLSREVEIGIQINRLRRTLRRERMKLEETLSEAKSPLERIKLEQKLKDEFKNLSDLREEILELSEQRVLARREEPVHLSKLRMYDRLLLRQQSKGKRLSRSYKLNRLSPKVKHYRF